MMFRTISYLKEVAEQKIKNGEKPYIELDLLFEIYVCGCNYEALNVKESLEELMK
jgi:hypothetical protein